MTRRILEAIATVTEPGVNLSFGEVDGRLDDPNKALLHAIAFADDTDEQNLTVEQALACFEKIDPLDREIRRTELRTQIKAAERAGQMEAALGLMKELRNLERDES
jgi:hypothetical protein